MSDPDKIDDKGKSDDWIDFLLRYLDDFDAK